MILNLESSRHQSRDLRGARMNVVHTIALSTKKMVMVMSRRLKARRLPWKMHRSHHALFRQQIQIAIHRRKIEMRDLFLRQGKQFLRQQRPPGILDGLPDRAALTGDANHGEMVVDTGPLLLLRMRLH